MSVKVLPRRLSRFPRSSRVALVPGCGIRPAVFVSILAFLFAGAHRSAAQEAGVASSSPFHATVSLVCASSSSGNVWTVHLHWQPLSASASYTIFRNGAVYRGFSGGSSFDDDNVVPGQTYRYLVRSTTFGSTRSGSLDSDTLYVTVPLEPCTTCPPEEKRLCLGGGRFKVSVTWHARHLGTSGDGQPVALTSDSGYFWFFQDSNVELVVKVLDGRAVNGHFWVFFGALTNVEYLITVLDTETNTTKTYSNAEDNLASGADTEAF